MHRSSRYRASRLFVAAICACLALSSAAQIAVRSVKVLGSKDIVEIEVESSDRIVPQSQVLTGPDRLVVDFPNALPSSQVRNQSIDRGEVKCVRVGVFQAKPPVTRLVLDLKSARSYQIFPYGRTVMIKVTGKTAGSATAAQIEDYPARVATRPGLVSANYTTAAEPVRIEASAAPTLQVLYRDGLLSIHANRATLAQVLYAVQQRTGADISIAAGAEQEQVVAEIDPAPAPDVVARLLNGSRFNFMILSASNDPLRLDRVILSTRTEGTYVPSPAQPAADEPAQESSFTRSEPSPADARGPSPPPPQSEIKDDAPEQ